ncbi:MAG: AMP-binding protein [Woeseiaceae bacterium]|jgi:acyl-CoA synthetase (AMP-forming)/AMP-acid ligase II|nr:AMP-binding protein [Woeseiaceae bacterium]
MAWYTRKPLTVPDIIALNADYLGEKPAVVDGERRVSWRDFGAGTARVANALADSGLAKGDRVIVLMKNSYEMAEAMFGAIRGGFVAVPLNVSITDAAVAGMITNSNARAVFTSDEHTPRVDGLRDRIGNQVGDRFITLQPAIDGFVDYATFVGGASDRPPDVSIGPADECNIIYSSGTTGLPKGIVHDHACREAWASDMAVPLRYHSGAVTLCNLGLFSNISWVAMLATMYAGGTIVIDRHFAPETTFELIERERITHSAMVPLQYQKLVECDAIAEYDLSSLDAYMCCGSPLAPALKRAVMEKLPGEFIELYGLTEGLVTILSPEDMTAKIDSVGRPSPGQRLVILDAEDRLLPAGEPGEIVGHARFMMAGYHDNDEANAEATWMHPDGSRWLRTGDIGKLDEDGFLYLVDRKKDMIISGGQNIYPADIETIMLGHAAVSEVAVIGIPHAKWGETPLAIVVRTADVDAAELTAWTNTRTGKQQRIIGTVFVDELPRNPNGKVLKRELRKTYADYASEGQ